jgi:hypothetical protein
MSADCDDDEEDVHARSVIERHRNELIDKAERCGREYADVRLVGLILEREAPEAPTFLAKLPASEAGLPSFSVLVARDYALSLLEAVAPEALDWLPSDEPEGSLKRLPVIFTNRRGLCCVQLEYEPQHT